MTRYMLNFLFRLLLCIVLIIPTVPLLWFVFICIRIEFGELRKSIGFIFKIPFLLWYDYVLNGDDIESSDRLVDKYMK